jgi:hypothetical protein
MAVAAAAGEGVGAGAGPGVEGVAVEGVAGEGALAGSTLVGRGAGVTPGSPYTQSHPSPAALAVQDFCLVFCA